MHIKKLQLSNFKRFSNLEIDLNYEKSARLAELVLLIGANGSGKSSIFDAFETLNILVKDPSFPFSKGSNVLSSQYYAKNANDFGVNLEFASNYIQLQQNGSESSIETDLKSHQNIFYGRSAFRYTPKITKTTIGTSTNVSNDPDRPKSYIEYDISRFDNDLDTFVVSQLRAFNAENPRIKTEFNNKFNLAFQNIFNLGEEIALKYIDFETPADGKPFQFLFKKGDSSFNYDLLSAGEKMVFELLFNLYSRANLYTDSVVFLDEIDLHLNTSLQYNFLKEITENWIPENCQLWVASHSLGFIEYARDFEKGVIIDFDNLDFDQKQKLAPTNKNMFNIAIPDVSLHKLLSLAKVIWVENENSEILSKINFDERIVFLSANSSAEVYKFVLADKNAFGLRDKDFLTKNEVSTLEQRFPNYRILDYYCFENYLLHPENIKEAFPKISIGDYTEAVTRQIIENQDKILVQIGGLSATIEFSNTSGLRRDENWKEQIMQALKSSDFETKYQYFNMKSKKKGGFCDYSALCETIKLQSLDFVTLSHTNWFKSKIQTFLDRA